MMPFLKEIFRPMASRVFARPVDVAGLYTSAPALGRRIPNVVYQTWKQPVLAWRHARALRRFRRLNADYSFRFFDDAQMAAYMKRNFTGHPVLDVFNGISIPTSRADVWRYCILHREGGIYCDIDSALTVPFRQLLADDPAEMISFENGRWQEMLNIASYADPEVFLKEPNEPARRLLECPERIVLNWLLCFEPGHPILTEVIDLIVHHAHFYRGRKFPVVWPAVVHFTGPLALTQAVWRTVEKTGRAPAQSGVDFRGHGIFKIPGEEHRYRVSPHYTELAGSSIL